MPLLFGLIIFLFACNYDVKTITKKVAKQETPKSKKIITPPIPKLDIKYSKYLINPQKDTMLVHKSGSLINIPKNAFLDAKGNVINQKVKIEYREFANAFDTYLAGIPMIYDTLGQKQVFETAGMLEINATSNNKSVYVNPKNKIKIDMNSFQKGSRYNLYQLNESSGKWKSIGKDKVEEKKYAKTIDELPKVPPKPKIATPSSFTISDSINGKNPELAIYKNVLFEPISGSKCGFSPTEIKINELKDGKYELNFIFKGRVGKDFKDTVLFAEQKCICYLAFKKGEDYDSAMQVYQKKYASKIAENQKLKDKIQKEWDDYKDIKKKYDEAGFLDIFHKKEISHITDNDSKITRTLEVMNFGFINIDYPEDYPQGAELLVKYQNKRGNKLKLKKVVLIEKGRNVLFRYGKKIKFNPDKENILWGLTENNHLAYFKSQDFKKIEKKKGECVFKMNVYRKKIKTYEDIASILFK